MPTLYSTVNETGNRNRILERYKIRFCLVHWIDPRSIEHNYACLRVYPTHWIDNYVTSSSMSVLVVAVSRIYRRPAPLRLL